MQRMLKQQELMSESFFSNIPLKIIVDVVEKYKQGSMARKLFFGVYKEEKEVQDYLSAFQEVSEDYCLNEHDLFKLFCILKKNSHLSVIVSLRAIFKNDHFFELIQALDKTSYPKIENYLTLFKLSPEAREFLYQLCCVERGLVKLSPEILFFVKAMGSAPLKIYHEKVLHILSDNRLCQHDILNLFAKLNAEKGFIFYKTLEVLAKYKFINHDTVMILLLNRLSSSLPDLINSVGEARLLTKEFLEKISKTSPSDQFVRFIDLLVKANCLNRVTFSLLLAKDGVQLYGLYHLAQTMLDMKLLNKENVFLLFSIDEPFPLETVLKLLFEKKLLSQHVFHWIKRLREEKIRFFRSSINYLIYAGILDENTLRQLMFYFEQKYYVAFYSFINKLDKYNFRISAECFEMFFNHQKLLHSIDDLNQIIVCLGDDHVLSNDLLKIIFQLAEKNIYRLLLAIKNLSAHHLLNEASFKEAYQLIISKLPPVVESKAEKIMHSDRVEYILDGKKTFFAEQKPYYEGGEGIVKRVYATESLKDKSPIYALKQLKEKAAIKDAKREVKYQRLLGREAFFFVQQPNKYIVSQWCSGKVLEDFLPNELKNIPLQKRLRALITGLRELKILHHLYRVHGDIKPLNIIFNDKKEEMKLIDFGASRKLDSIKDFVFTIEYLPKQPAASAYHFSEDVYSMGIVIAFLFPELYDIDIVDGEESKITLRNSTVSLFEYAICTLVSAMIQPNADSRCSVNDALNYCEQLENALNAKTLTKELIGKLQIATINHTPLTSDDVIHWRHRL